LSSGLFRFTPLGQRQGEDRFAPRAAFDRRQYPAGHRQSNLHLGLQSHSASPRGLRGSLANNGTFTYNNAGRMTRAQGITTTQVYTYNGDGLLMNRNTTRYV
jgi:hypothetical protein